LRGQVEVFPSGVRRRGGRDYDLSSMNVAP
jgi:hypothetical protein